MRGDELGGGGEFRSLITRLGWAVCALLSLSFLAVGAVSFFADLYTSLAVQQRTKSFASPVALHAAQLATRIAPWKAKAWSEYASSASQSRETDLALSAISQAIYWAPADAEKWAVMTRILLAGGRFDRQLKLAISRITKLAPNAPQLQKQIAFEGLYLWRYGDGELHEIWLDSMRNSYRYEKDLFLLAVVQRRRENDFCRYAGKALKLDKWCEWAVYARRICSANSLTQEQRNFCLAVGFVAAKKP